MSDAKFLSDSVWKDLSAKHKIKDTGLQKTLVDLKKVDDDAHDEVLKILEEVLKQAGVLKKSKEVAANTGVFKHVIEVIAAAEEAKRKAAKAAAEGAKERHAKLEAEKKAKAEAEAEKKAKADAEAQAKKKEKDDAKSNKDTDADEDGDEAAALLTTKLIPLLRSVKSKGERMYALLATTGKQVVVLLSRKPIPPARRKLMQDELGVSGGIKYIHGDCIREHGKVMFVLERDVAGMGKLITAALLKQTNQRIKVKCRTQDGEYDEDDDVAEDDAEDDTDTDEGDESANDEAEADEDDGDLGSEREQAADEPPKSTTGGGVAAPPPELARAPLLWDTTRDLMQKNIEALKAAVQAQLADEGADVVKQITDQMKQLDRIVGRLDTRLSESLLKAGAAPDPGERRAELGITRAILADYIRYVASEPLIAHLDANPFGVKTDLKAMLTASLTKLARAIS